MLSLATRAELTRLKQQRAEQAAAAQAQTHQSNGHVEAEDDKSRVVPTKVNIRGLDNFNTQDIKQFAGEHYSTEQLQQRIEWVDDASANVVYNTEEAAAAALKAFTDLSESIPEQLSGLQSRKAKPHSGYPDTYLQVRLATAGDVKAPHAHERSRFYLMNPEHDPRERRRDYDNRPRRGNDGRRPERRRREERPVQKFDVSMYDDDTGVGEDGEVSHGASGDGYSSKGQDRRRPGRNNGQDLFADKSQGRLRDRSASPVRDGDGRFGFDESQPRRREARRRSFTPPESRRSKKPAEAAAKVGVELFPEKAGNNMSSLDTPVANGQVYPHPSSTAELFPASASPPKRNRELFPNKTSTSNHRRSDAFSAEEAAQAKRELLIVKQFLSCTHTKTGTLADRISAPSKNVLHDRPVNSRHENPGFSIRGSATDSAPGFSIRGASKELNPVVKELFPTKLATPNGAGGKDLFEDKLKSRNAPRRRAEDMF